MSALKLRPVSPSVAAVCQALGRGRWLTFTSADETVRLTIGPLLAPGTARDEHALALSSKQGALHLSNADALLSLCGEVPVISTEPVQGWYWQLINQQLSPFLYDLLSPLEPLPTPAPSLPERLDCHIGAERKGETVHGVLSAGADTLLRVLDAAHWQLVERPLPGDWPLHCPLVLGWLNVTVNELRSLRAGDVLLPSAPLFDINGSGQLQLGHRRWAVNTDVLHDHLQLRLIHEEGIDHEQ